MNRFLCPLWLAGVFLFLVLPCQSVELNYYLPSDTKYDDSIPTPKSSLGYEVGEWHVRHDQMVAYMKLLAEQSDRIEIEMDNTEGNSIFGKINQVVVQYQPPE